MTDGAARLVAGVAAPAVDDRPAAGERNRVAMKSSSGSNQVNLCGLRHYATWSEGRVTFSEVDGFYGVGQRITVEKREPTGLLYVSCQSTFGTVAAAHIRAAVEMAKEVLGPDHFESLETEAAYHSRLPLVKVTHFGPWRGWRSGLIQIRGRAVFRWGEYRRKLPRGLLGRLS